MAGEVEAAEEVGEGREGEGEGGDSAADGFAGADDADGWVFERGEDVRQKGTRPEDVVVSEDGDGRLDLSEGLAGWLIFCDHEWYC